MNTINVKTYAYGIIAIICLSGAILFFYNIGITTIMGLIKGGDYIYYDPKQIPLFLSLPVAFFFDLLVMCLFLPLTKRKKIVAMMQKLMIPVAVYGVSVLIISFLLSIAISIYPLGTDYYKCKSTSIVASGSYYARTKEMCKQRAYSAETDEEQSSATSDITSGTGNSNPEKDK